jgi:hypothetical protein
MASYFCQWCGQPLATQTARTQHEENCSENPANEGKQDE